MPNVKKKRSMASWSVKVHGAVGGNGHESTYVAVGKKRLAVSAYSLKINGKRSVIRVVDNCRDRRTGK